MTGTQEPRLTAEAVKIHCGYGPRSIHIARDGKALFVGCKDGSVTKIDLTEGPEGCRRPVRLCGPAVGGTMVGARSLCDLGHGWLVVGHDSGDLGALNWQSPRAEGKLEIARRYGSGAITYVGIWDERQLVVSYRKSPAVLLDIEPCSREHPPVLKQSGQLDDVFALSGMVETGTGERVLISKTGTLWWKRSDQLTPVAAWDNYDRPGFVFDLTAAKPPSGKPSEGGVYLSTDEGVFLLRPDPDPAAPHPFKVDRVSLPGFTGMSLAITHAVSDDLCLLWVSDRAGAVHLFWDDLDQFDPARGPIWRRSGIQQVEFPVMRALASWPSRSSRGPVGQTCRNDLVVVTWYEKSAAATPSQILSWGDQDSLKMLKEDPEKLKKDPSRKDWCIEALIADFIEETGEKQLQELTKFLRNPGTGLAFSALEEIRKQGPPERDSQAVTLWTHTLLGTVHRWIRERDDQNYLGIIRWLRRLSEEYSGKATALGKEHDDGDRLLASLEENIQYASKWGIFGKTYADRQNVLSALGPLSRQDTIDRRLDRLVYDSMLFQRRVNIEDEFPAPVRGGLTPWDVKHLRVGGQEYIAVSWIKGGVEVYRPVPGEELEARWKVVDGFRRRESEEETGSGYSRRILLGKLKVGEHVRAYLLEAPTRPGGMGSKPLTLRWIAAEEGAPTPGTLPADCLIETGPAAGLPPGEPRDPEKEESVYSLLELDPENKPGLVLVGLQGTEGWPRVGLLRIHSSGELQALPQKNAAPFPTPFPELKTVKRNPVWALASEKRDGGYTVVIGCGDGQIWKVRLCIDEDGFTMQNRTPVGRLGTPVWALTYRETWGQEEKAELRPPRVVAGGADGTLVAFQALGDWQKDKETYATLWALQEGGPVARLHTLSSNPAGGVCENLVLALTRQGMAILISDRAGVEELKPGDDVEKHHRFEVPGERLGRFSLGSTVFGSALLPLEEEGSTKPVARLAIATTDGTLRLLSLHYPKHTRNRHEEYQRLHREWLEHLQGGGPKIQGYLLRRPESIYTAAPELSTGLVRWILSPDPSEIAWEERYAGQPGMNEPRQWIPRHLQPLVDLDSAWSRLDPSASHPLRGKLKAALMSARAVEDRKLFKEILEVVLNRANHQLYDQARYGDNPDFTSAFLDLLADLEDVKGVWLGWPDNLDTKMRITIAKNLLDGDTLWRISKANTEGRKEFTRAMQGRIEQIHRFLAIGDPLLALETLRAANLALIRLCRRLDRPAQWQDLSGENHQLSWEAIKGFYEAVGDFAARAAHPKGSMGEVAAHEICRAYALGMLACPSALVRLSLWMAESDLPEELRSGVRHQFGLLKNLLGMGMPEGPMKLFQMLFDRRERFINYRRRLFLSHKDLIVGSKIGDDNVRLVGELGPFEEIIIWLHELAEKLSNNAENVDVELRKVFKLGWALRNMRRDQDQLSHSYKFWHGALKELRGKIKKFSHIKNRGGVGLREPEDDVRPRPVRPEVVLFSRTLEDWCVDQRKALREKGMSYEIFEPHSKIYDAALAVVERTAHRFREGAAVQKNMVLGVLGHGLLEILDEHLLELWEVAQALDPLRTWEQDRSERMVARERKSTAGQFADYLLERALNAETIPKNLRSLQGLLSYTGREFDAMEYDGIHTLQKLFEEFRREEKWDVPRNLWSGVELKPRKYHFLRLTLNELAQNDRCHGLRGQPEQKAAGNWYPRVEPPPPNSPQSLQAVISFWYPDRERDCKALQDALKASDFLQRMVPARPEPRFPSHGTGLYLANLAAAAVGWKLEVVKSVQRGLLQFKLHRKDEGIDE